MPSYQGCDDNIGPVGAFWLRDFRAGDFNLDRVFDLLFRLVHHTSNANKMDDSKGLAIAFEEAKLSYSEGGIPVSELRRIHETVDDMSRPRRRHRSNLLDKTIFPNTAS